jgi:tetratricopeptide (TPR) repeat protein
VSSAPAAPPARASAAGPVAFWLWAAGLRLWSLSTYATLPTVDHLRLDAAAYDELARRVVGGDLLLGPEPYHLSPLYTYLVAGIYAVTGGGVVAVLALQLVLGLAAVELTRRAALRLFGAPWSWVAAGLVAGYGPLVHAESQISVAAVSTLLGIALIERLVAWLDDDRAPLPPLALVGLLAGLAVVARPNALLLLPPLLLCVAVVAWHRAGVRRAMTALLLSGAAMAAPILPVTARNVVVAGEPILVTDSGGLNFYLGNGQDANGAFRVPAQLPTATNAFAQFRLFREYAGSQVGRPLSAREADAWWYDLTWREIAADRGAWAGVLLTKLRLVLANQELPNSDSFSLAQELNAALLLAPVRWALLAPLALLGLGLAVAGRDRRLLVPAVWLTLMAGALVLFFVLSHYRVPLIGAVALLATAGLRWTWAAARLRPAVAAVTVGLLAGGAWTSTRDVLEEPMSEEWRKLGYAYHVQGRLDEAAAAYLHSLDEDATNLSTRKNLARLLMTRGLAGPAIEQWRAVVRIGSRTGATRYVDEARAALAQLGAPPEGSGP